MPGTATSPITDENGQLMIRFTHSPVLVGKLEHWQYDTFVPLARWSRPARCGPTRT